MKNYLTVVIITLLIGALAFLLIKYNFVVEDNTSYEIQIEKLDEENKKLAEEKKTLYDTIRFLKDSLKKQKIETEYIYIEIDSIKEVIEKIPEDEVYEALDKKYPESDSSKKIYPFSGEQVKELYLASTERDLYADLASQLSKTLNTSDDIIKQQNKLITLQEEQLATEKLKSKILEDQLNYSDKQLKRKKILNTALTTAVALEGIIITILSISK